MQEDNGPQEVASNLSPVPNSPSLEPISVPPPPKRDLNILLFVVFAVVALITVALGIVYTQERLKSKSPQVAIQNPQNTINQEKFTLVIGTDATYPPMEFINTDGQLTGYDIDLGTRIAEKMGLTPEFKNITWDDLFPALEEGKVDIIMAGVTITSEREEKYAFTNPYLNAGQVIITATGSAITSTSDLAGSKIGVQKTTTNEEEALKYTSSEFVIAYEDFTQATEALVNGEVDAIFSDLTNAKGIVDENPGLVIASDPFTSEQYGIVVKKDDSELVAKLNTALNELRQQGVLVTLKQKWLE